MKLILNDKEIIFYLSSLLDYTTCYKDIEHNQHNTAEAMRWSIERKDKLWKFRDKIKERLYHGVKTDLKEYISKISIVIDEKKQKDIAILKSKIDTILEKLNENNVIEEYKKSQKEGFCKSPGLMIDPNATLVRRKNYSDISDDCMIRNTVGNEKFLTEKIDRSLPFWFIDSGYTNFIEPNKKWHRLVRNHLHFHKLFDAPCDRLGMFREFPKEWRNSGDRILVIEPGQFAANIFHVDIKQWKYNVEKEIKKYSDKKIVFREKAPKKKRAPLHKHLLEEDYFCVVNINSNAATESIWAGVPVITLDKHITNSISKSNISDINNLYRGPLGNWLAMLSYSQFTYQELIDGTAVNIVRKYHV